MTERTKGKAISTSKVDLTTLCVEYDRLRAEEGIIKKAKDQLSVQIKAAFGDRLDIPNPVFKLAYHYDEPRTTYTVDYASFKQKAPALYQKWVHEEVIPGSRRLQVTRLEDLQGGDIR